MAPTVIVVGGGYGGSTVAKALDEVADVVLVEPREAFVHNVAALRAAVDPEWADRLFIPYDGLLARGRRIRDRAVRVALHGGRAVVTVGSGDTVAGDYAVLATGSSYPFPARIAGADGPERLRAAHRELARAERVLLVGAGPVGLEFAGEIKAAWPEKRVTLVDRSGALMPGFPAEFRRLLREQLDELGVQVRLSTEVGELPEPGRYAPFAEADIWFPCYGGQVTSDYLDGGLAAARRADGRVEVTADLRVRGTGNVFAVGDVTAVPELKMARLAQMHAEVVAANIRKLIEGDGRLRTYEPQPDAIVLPLGPKGGVTYAPEVGVLGAGPTADIKAGFYLDRYRELLGA